MHFPPLLLVLVSFVVPFGSSREIHSRREVKFLSDVIIPLENNEWRLRSDDGVFENLEAKVPGDLLSDLMLNDLIDDPYIDRNFLTQNSIWIGDRNASDGRYENMKEADNSMKRTWIYSTVFETPENSTTGMSWKVVLEGIKMGANVLVNGKQIGQVIDQFLRYDLEVGSDVLQRGSICGNNLRCHNLTISFDPSICVNGRFSACSGGWDWSPYTKVKDFQQFPMFTLGIIKPVYLIGIGIQGFFVSHVVPKVNYLGAYPTRPMQHPEGDFRLDVDVHLSFIEQTSFSSIQNSSIILKSDFADQIEEPIEAPTLTAFDGISAVVTLSLTVPHSAVELWWPNGMGEQRLYNIYVGTNQIDDKWIRKRIGFRTTSLVTTNENSTEELMKSSDTEGSGQHGMYFRINGAIVMARGANFIPMDQLEGRLSSEAHEIVVRSASKANMNMIRVWGGGMVPLASFYDTCDEEGILIYHDMMFVDQAGHRPSRTDTVSKEIRYLVRSLASHPSLVLWNGCNECSVEMGTPSEIYAAFVMETVVEEDDTRPIWPSSPSNHGWRQGVRRIDGRPFSRNLRNTSLVTWDPHSFRSVLESHGPYMRSFSSSFPGVNGMDVHFPYSNTPPELKKVDVGYNFPNEFASEFGCTTMSSFESMTGTITSWSLHGGGDPDHCVYDYGNINKCNGTNIMAERNYPCDSHLRAYFGIEEVELSEIGEKAFRKQLYMCLMGQTLWMKGEIESRRSKNYFGLLIWQLNEIWPTGGWGLLEYGTRSHDGSQIIGGRWKPLMHLLESSLFADQIVACGSGDLCYVRNDHFEKVKVAVAFEAWGLGEKAPRRTYEFEDEIEPGSLDWFELPFNFTSNTQVTLIQLKVYRHDSLDPTPRISDTVYLKDMPKNIEGLHKQVHIDVVHIRGTDDGNAEIVLASGDLALFVVLTTRAEGIFSRNCITLRPFENTIINFEPIGNAEKVDLETLKASLRIEHLGLYVSPSSNDNFDTNQSFDSTDDAAKQVSRLDTLLIIISVMIIAAVMYYIYLQWKERSYSGAKFPVDSKGDIRQDIDNEFEGRSDSRDKFVDEDLSFEPYRDSRKSVTVLY